jgi:hypothetical protein
MYKYELSSDLLEFRKNIVYEVADKMEGIGKTGMMKAMYFLQQIYKIPLGYDFKMYSYGPFDDDVLVAMDVVKDENLIDIIPEDYGDGVSGYSIRTTKKGHLPSGEYSEFIDALSNNFGGYSAKEWELTSTIVYVHTAYMENGWNLEELYENVRRIKPRFGIDEIKKEHERLKELGILDMAI